MSAGQTPTSEIPFGYSFNPDRDIDFYSHPSSRPELLGNDERDMLNNFFQDPDSVDPTILFENTDFQTHNGGLYGDSPFGWTYTNNGEYSSGAGPLPELKPLQAQGQDSNRADFNSYGFHQQHEEDVYNAAKVLHGNRTSHQSNRSGADDHAHYQRRSTAPQPSNTAGYNYPPIQSYPTTPFDFPNSSSNGFYQQAPPRPGRNEAPVHTNGSSQVINNISGDIRAGPLRFGSDDKFRSGFAGQVAKPPDQDLSELVTQHFTAGGKPIKRQGSAPQSPDTSASKRGRGRAESEGTSHSDGGDESSDEDVARARKRRKSRIKDEDEDFEEPSARSRRKKKSPSSPHKRRKSSPGAAKNSRENLTEEQKRSNHIQSEQKRRNLIKQGFEDLGRMVPELRPGGLSKSNILLEVAKFMRNLKKGNDELRAHIDSLNPG